MNKEQTHKKIKKIIHLYEKRISTCSEQLDMVMESQTGLGTEISELSSEIDLMEAFVDDLQSLMVNEDE